MSSEAGIFLIANPMMSYLVSAGIEWSGSESISARTTFMLAVFSVKVTPKKITKSSFHKQHEPNRRNINAKPLKAPKVALKVSERNRSFRQFEPDKSRRQHAGDADKRL
jgi:hypothetical protein